MAANHAAARARCRLPARAMHADQGPSRRVCDARCGRTAHARAVLHVRREAGEPGGMVLAAVGSAPCRHAGTRQGRDGPRRCEPERTAGSAAGRTACHPRRRPQDARQSRAGRGGRGGDRLAELSADRARTRGACGAVEERRRIHAGSRPGVGRQHHHHARQQGGHRVRPDRERRQVGSRADGARRAFVAGRATRSAGVAPGAGAEHAGHAERRSGDRRLLREGAAVDACRARDARHRREAARREHDERVDRHQDLGARRQLAPGAGGWSVTADRDDRGARRRLHRCRRQDDPAAPDGREARHAHRAGHDAGTTRSPSSRRISRSAASATSKW